MRKVFTLSVGILAITSVLTFIFFANTHFRKSKIIDLLPLAREQTQAGDTDLKAQTYDSLHVEEAVVSLVNAENQLTWRLVIQRMSEGDEGYYALSNIQGRYYPSEGEAFQFTAEKGRMTKDFSELNLCGQVTVYRSDLELQAQEMSWSAQADQIQVKKEVRVRRDGLEIDAELVETDSNFAQLKIEGDSTWRFIR